MALATYVEDLETLDEPVRELYKEIEGGFILDTEPVNGYELDNIEGLKSALVKERKAAKEYDRQINTYKTKYEDIDPDEYRSAMDKLEELSKFNPETEAEKLAEQKFENAKKRLQSQLDKGWEAKWANEYEPLKKQNEVMMSQLRKELVNASALKAISAEGGDTELLMPHIVNKISFSQKPDGTFATEIVDENGEPMFNSQGGYMSTQELVATYKSKFPSAFKAPQQSGGGTPPVDGSGGSDTPSVSDRIMKLRPGESLL